MNNPRKIVPDTGFILQATLNPQGTAGRALALIEIKKMTILLSPQVREEYEDVLRRPMIWEKYPRLGDGRAEAMLQRLDSVAKVVTVIRPYLQYPRDPNDEPILNLAIQEQADYIIARDRDLLDLQRSADFRLLYPFLKVVDPLTFLRGVEQAEQEQTPA